MADQFEINRRAERILGFGVQDVGYNDFSRKPLTERVAPNRKPFLNKDNSKTVGMIVYNPKTKTPHYYSLPEFAKLKRRKFHNYLVENKKKRFEE